MTRLVPALWLAACAAERAPCEGRRDLLQSEAGLALTRAEHPRGWGHRACFQCHPAWTFHQEDCLDGAVVDPDALGALEPADCASCHGPNGVAEWREEAP